MTTDRKHEYEKTQRNHKVMNNDHHEKQNDHKETKDINHKEREKDLIHSQKKNKMMGCGVFTCLCRGALSHYPILTDILSVSLYFQFHLKCPAAND